MIWREKNNVDITAGRFWLQSFSREIIMSIARFSYLTSFLFYFSAKLFNAFKILLVAAQWWQIPRLIWSGTFFPSSLKVVFYVCDLWNYTCFYSLASFVFQESSRRSTIIWGACRPKRLWRQVDKAWWRFSRTFENVGMSLRKRGWRIELNVEKMQIGGFTELENLWRFKALYLISIIWLFRHNFCSILIRY